MKTGAEAQFSRTATAFETVGDIYAPYKRQVNSQYKSTLPIPEQLSLEAGIPTSDAVSAFDYYIEHLNKGRPFILAGHSQGSNLLANILSGYMKDHPDLYERMVAAYIIGFSITSDYLAQNPQLKFANGPDDTGVIISYASLFDLGCRCSSRIVLMHYFYLALLPIFTLGSPASILPVQDSL
jgi:pimeloyl-ACP methyl ester carboxylesterase